jgi:hypothetical protein
MNRHAYLTAMLNFREPAEWLSLAETMRDQGQIALAAQCYWHSFRLASSLDIVESILGRLAGLDEVSQEFAELLRVAMYAVLASPLDTAAWHELATLLSHIDMAKSLDCRVRASQVDPALREIDPVLVPLLGTEMKIPHWLRAA